MIWQRQKCQLLLDTLRQNNDVRPLQTSTVVREHPSASVCYTPGSCLFPSPLRVSDLEKAPDTASDHTDDTIPELVEINSGQSQTLGGPSTVNHSAHCSSSPLSPPSHVQNPQLPANIAINESEMYILTDSFLDDSPTLFMSNSRFTPHQTNGEVLVVDDYTAPPVVSAIGPSQTVTESPWSHSVPSPHWTSNKPPVVPSSVRHSEIVSTAAVPLNVSPSYQEKALLDWSSDDVLAWLVDVGLGQFYNTFKCEKSQTVNTVVVLLLLFYGLLTIMLKFRTTGSYVYVNIFLQCLSFS